jgi:hypothetical protein
MSMSSRASLQTPIAQRCDVVTKTPFNHQVMGVILTSACMCSLNIKPSCYSQHALTQCIDMQRHNYKWSLHLRASTRS